MRNIFTDHPYSVNETYFVHLRVASKIGIRLVFAGLACIVHSIFPFIFKSTATRTVRKINDELTDRYSRRINEEIS